MNLLIFLTATAIVIIAVQSATIIMMGKRIKAHGSLEEEYKKYIALLEEEIKLRKNQTK